MTIWQRVKRIFRSRQPARQFDAASLDASYREQAELLQQVRRGLADLTTGRRRMELQMTQLQRETDRMHQQASAAVAAGDDERARAILQRQVGVEAMLNDLTDQHGKMAAEEEKLAATARSIESKIEAFRAQKDTLKARYSAAKARSEIQDAVTGVTAESSAVGQTLHAAERHTREIEAKADAIDELVAEGLMSDATQDDAAAFDRQFEALKSQSELADEKLSQLKDQQAIDG